MHILLQLWVVNLSFGVAIAVYVVGVEYEVHASKWTLKSLCIYVVFMYSYICGYIAMLYVCMYVCM